MPDLPFRHFLDRLKDAVAIEDVVRRRVPGLRASGAEWKACCPFHDERTPSFYVVPRKGIFHCFGCGKSGDAIGFVEAFDGVTFIEAVEELAGSVGLEVPRRSERNSQEDARLQALREALERAARLFRKKLLGPDGEAARRYLGERGLGADVGEAFGLGWAPSDGRALVEAARESGFQATALLDSGLARRNDRGELYDFFRGRLVVPIRDERGRVVGFGGRLLPGVEGPKYVNTAETPLFHKGKLVFGLDLAADAARRERHVVVVEGYTDVMAAHQAGVRNVVAVLGTATTEQHARLLRRTGAQRLTLVFDGDRAGRAAALKALHGVLVRDDFERVDVVALPEGADPCDLLAGRNARPEVFRDAVRDAREWFDYLADGVAAESGASEIADAVDRALEVVAVLPNPVEREARARALAGAAGLSETSVLARFDRISDDSERVRTAGRAASEGRRPAAVGGARGAHSAPAAPAAGQAPPSRATKGVRQQELRAWAELVGACLVDNSLVALHRERLESAREGRGPEHEGLARVLETLCDVYDEDELAHERAPGSVLPPIDAVRIADLLAVAELEALDADGEDAGGAPFAEGAGGAPEGPAVDGTEQGVGSIQGVPTRTGSAVGEARSIAVRIEERARSADDIRALASGAASVLDRLDRERVARETLSAESQAAAARGEDPELRRLEAANRVFGLAGRADHGAKG